MKKKKSNVIPIFEEYVRKNPPIEKPLFGEPRRWEDILDEDQYWYEEEPMFDDDGNYIGMKKIFMLFLKELLVGEEDIQSQKIIQNHYLN